MPNGVLNPCGPGTKQDLGRPSLNFYSAWPGAQKQGLAQWTSRKLRLNRGSDKYDKSFAPHPYASHGRRSDKTLIPPNLASQEGSVRGG